MKINLVKNCLLLILSINLTLLFILDSRSGAQSKLPNTKSKRVTTNNHRMPFRYIIYQNIVDKDNDSDESEGSRYIEVLLDSKAFSEATLRELFQLLSMRFPKPINMDVQVFTNIEQTPTPEEMGRGVSEQPENHWVESYPSAFMIRQPENEIIRYSPSPPYRREKTVILKGKDLLR